MANGQSSSSVRPEYSEGDQYSGSASGSASTSSDAGVANPAGYNTVISPATYGAITGEKNANYSTVIARYISGSPEDKVEIFKKARKIKDEKERERIMTLLSTIDANEDLYKTSQSEVDKMTEAARIYAEYEKYLGLGYARPAWYKVDGKSEKFWEVKGRDGKTYALKDIPGGVKKGEKRDAYEIVNGVPRQLPEGAQKLDDDDTYGSKYQIGAMDNWIFKIANKQGGRGSGGPEKPPVKEEPKETPDGLSFGNKARLSKADEDYVRARMAQAGATPGPSRERKVHRTYRNPLSDIVIGASKGLLEDPTQTGSGVIAGIRNPFLKARAFNESIRDLENVSGEKYFNSLSEKDKKQITDAYKKLADERGAIAKKVEAGDAAAIAQDKELVSKMKQVEELARTAVGNNLAGPEGLSADIKRGVDDQAAAMRDPNYVQQMVLQNAMAAKAKAEAFEDWYAKEKVKYGFDIGKIKAQGEAGVSPMSSQNALINKLLEVWQAAGSKAKQ